MRDLCQRCQTPITPAEAARGNYVREEWVGIGQNAETLCYECAHARNVADAAGDHRSEKDA